MKRPRLCLSLAALAAVSLAGAAAAAPTALVPAPAVERPGQGAFRLSAGTPVVVPAGDAGARAAADYFLDLMRRSRGLPLKVRNASGDAPGAVAFRRGGPSGEAYQLDVTPLGVVVTASDDAGLFYGAISAWQLATAEDGKGPTRIEAVHIEDAPRFAWRGLMLDSARHYQSPAFIKAFLDRMARAKLNTFHWHLADDQGWRLEIRKYPKLTEVGAWRVPAGQGPAADIDPRTGKPRQIGGFYTQAEVREIVAYAAARHITIIPEIDMPGHATAAIAAYPELGSIRPAPAAPSNEWGVLENLLNVEEPTFAFINDVLDEVMELFPGKYIHVGGDEAVKAQWKSDPAVQARMKALHISDETALQGWFMGRLEQHLTSRGRKLIGWDEILEGGISRGATVMSWRGTDGAIIAAKMGHDTVMAAWPTYYFDNRQGPLEPLGRGRVVDLKEVYEFDPVPAALDEAQRKHVLGVQAQLWTEHMRTEDRVSKLAFPRALAVAETGWSPAGKRNYGEFSQRLAPELARERALGAVFSDAPLTPTAAVLSERTRSSQELKLCSDNIPINLEDDAPTRGQRATFLVDIMNPCWVWQGADLTGVRSFEASVGQLPFNFQIGEAIKQVRHATPETPEGELVVRRDGCAGEVISTVPLAAAARNPATTKVRGQLPALQGPHDLCFTFTQTGIDPFWALDRVTLGEPARGR